MFIEILCLILFLSFIITISIIIVKIKQHSSPNRQWHCLEDKCVMGSPKKGIKAYALIPLILVTNYVISCLSQVEKSKQR